MTFRLVPPGTDLQQANEINHEIVEAVRRDGRVFISSTLLDGKFTIRMAALAFRTHKRQIDLAIEILREKAARY